ncbi:MAG: gamma-glutamyltransferase [Woeseiaceae bacterium]|nr:gamma-glutamyltransferase [Woeseiaceae bacterium]
MARNTPRVAVAASSQDAADAGAEIAEQGGNAVDCAIAAAMYSINTEPGVCALAGSAFVTVWPAGEDPLTIDGNVAIPGMGLAEDFQPEAESVYMEYGGGVETFVGCASVAVPGTPAALHLASQRFGRVEWRQLLQPVIRATRKGFALPAACNYYLGYSGDVIFGRSEAGHGALHDDDGKVIETGGAILVPQLADSLTAIAEGGSEVFYTGELGRAIAEHVQKGGGFLSLQDLENYQPLVRDSLMTRLGNWQIASNPPPAVGGAVLAAMLIAFDKHPISRWDDDAVRQLLRVQQAALSYRRGTLDLSDDVAKDVATLLELAKSGELLSRRSSSATVHTSAVDDSGLACAITASSGYGSGEMPAGTGLWLNNCFGEIELNRRGYDAAPPGKRLPSNMAPSVARTEGRILAMGSPGADRITTALQQFLINHLQLGQGLAEAIAHPRLHLEIDGAKLNIAVEPGLDIPPSDVPITRYPDISMYFGGVVAALFDSQSGFVAAADPRREGGTRIC